MIFDLFRRIVSLSHREDASAMLMKDRVKS